MTFAQNFGTVYFAGNPGFTCHQLKQVDGIGYRSNFVSSDCRKLCLDDWQCIAYDVEQSTDKCSLFNGNVELNLVPSTTKEHCALGKTLVIKRHTFLGLKIYAVKLQFITVSWCTVWNLLFYKLVINVETLCSRN